MTTKLQKFVLFQAPNPPLYLAAAFWLLAKFIFISGSLHNYLTFGFGLALLWWSLLEIFRGSNWFRRLLGFIGLYFAVLSLLNAFS